MITSGRKHCKKYWELTHNKNADVPLSIERFPNEIIHASRDVVLVLGSINFGDKDTITQPNDRGSKTSKTR